MRCLSVVQPWASLLISGIKTFETRGWHTKELGRIAIHASKTVKPEIAEVCMEEPYASALKAMRMPSWREFPRGVIIGLIDLVECVLVEDLKESLSEQEAAFGDFRPGKYAWRMANPTPLAVPIEQRGGLGMFILNDKVFNLSKIVEEKSKVN